MQRIEVGVISFQNDPPHDFFLASGEAHIWAGPLDISLTRQTAYAQWLSPDENQRAARFIRQQDRHRFIAGRGMLRNLLGRYLHADPGHLRFCYGAQGKPALSNPAENTAAPAPSIALQFNLAHADNLILIAVTRECAIGIDVEKLRPMDRPEDVARLCLSAGELATLQALPPAQRPGAFFTLWTRKEAVLKATGDGIANMAQLDLSSPCCPTPPTADPRASTPWTILDLNPAPGFVAALAAPQSNLQISCWHWPDSW